jgi:glycosyltransferase involved in cell wall biosynthesis
MRITINIESMYCNPTGMGRHIRALIPELAKIDKENSYTLFHSNLYESNFCRINEILPENFSIVKLPFARKSMTLRRLINFSFSLSKYTGSHDIYHEPGGISFSVDSRRILHAIHDTAAYRFPFAYTAKDRIFSHITKKQAKNADMILTVSYFSKYEISEIFNIDSSKIRVVYNAIDDIFINKPESKTENILKKYEIDRPYFFFCGVLNYRKSLNILVDAFKQFLDKTKENILLVLAGPNGYGFHEIEKAIKNNKIESNVKLTGFVNDEDLVSLMSHANLFIFPSLFEGFGLPVLEAMACETPVICSKTSSLPEVGGDAAWYIDPLNTEELVAGMHEVFYNSQLRSSLINKGKERIKYFSWSQSANNLLNIYRELNN